jgi:hypothetical protein
MKTSALTILPTANLAYPQEIIEERSILLAECATITEKTDIRKRLAWIIKTINLMEKQLSFENDLRIRAFARHQINKITEANRLLR